MSRVYNLGLYFVAALISVFLLSSCKFEKNDGVQMPKAKKVPYTYEVHGIQLVDNYHWLRDENWPKVEKPEVLEYLNAENEYFEHHIKDIKDTEDELFEEIKDRIKEDDESAPIKEDDYYYYSFIKKGQDYKTYARKYKNLDAKPEIILDQNELAKGFEYFSVAGVAVSPNHKYLAYGIDYKGDERYTIRVKDLETNQMLEDSIPDLSGGIVWHQTSDGFFYVRLNEKFRGKDAYYHKLGTDVSDDVHVYHEEDDTFRVGVGKTGSRDYIIISVVSSLESEKYYLSAREKDFDLKLIKKREKDVRFGLTHQGDYFYLNINDKGNNFRVVRIPSSVKKGNWKDGLEEIFAHDDEKYIEDFSAHKNFFILESKALGLPKIELFDNNLKKIKEIKFEDEAYSAYATYTPFEQKKLRYGYSSPRTPSQVLEYDLETKKVEILKEQEVPSGFDSSKYVVKREWVKARDGEMVPITILYNRELFDRDDGNALYLYGYGSYGVSIPLSFRSTIFSLVDRGFVYVLAGIRGGDDLGIDWHEKAKFTNKKKTFLDFIDVADYLVEHKYTKTGEITISGGSAGGMLVGYCLNSRPELYRATIMHVPFVDVLNTMLDDSLPLTVGEFKEWGNPKDKKIFDYMITYSPYENIKKVDYPHIFVTAGLTDPRVTYWEPAKYIAKIRDYKTDDNLVFLKTNMSAGHAGKSGRYDAIREIAEEYNILLNLFYK